LTAKSVNLVDRDHVLEFGQDFRLVPKTAFFEVTLYHNAMLRVAKYHITSYHRAVYTCYLRGGYKAAEKSAIVESPSPGKPFDVQNVIYNIL
jgi:hypothetical protein